MYSAGRKLDVDRLGEPGGGLGGDVPAGLASAGSNLHSNRSCSVERDSPGNAKFVNGTAPYGLLAVPEQPLRTVRSGLPRGTHRQ
jgi:hypothetical protein